VRIVAVDASNFRVRIESGSMLDACIKAIAFGPNEDRVS
jgi:hypothetical protein